jgi:DNA-binding winged helix-turn-helix (wHTH) protein
MEVSRHGIFGFGNFRLETRERTLTEGDHTIQLPPKIFDTLLLLVENAGHVVSKESMLARIWEDSFVEENNLAQNISALRRVLRERSGKKFIETVPKLGYRFVAEVEEIDSQTIRTDIFEHTRAQLFLNKTREGSQALFTTTSTFRPETYYVRNGNVNIAYQVVGDGPVAVLGEEERGGLPGVAVERPAVAQQDRAPSAAPVPVEDLGTVIGLHHGHRGTSTSAWR